MRFFVFSLIICVLALFFFGCAPMPEVVSEQAGQEENFSPKSDESAQKEPLVQEVSRVVGEFYHSDKVASNIWELSVYDGRLFLGCGDYNENSGSTPVYSFSLSDLQETKQEGVLETESITRFHLLSGGLAVSSTDPTTPWTQGNFFLRDDSDGSWREIVIPYAVHNFDLVEYNGALFCALGVKPNTPASPVMRSIDGGKTWEELAFIKEGTTFDPAERGTDFCRAYDFVLHGGSLYVSLLLDGGAGTEFALYRYEEAGFVYYTSLQNKVGLSHALPFQRPFGAVFSFADRVYLTSGKLFVSEDLENFSELVLGEFTAVWDLWLEGDALYVLTSTSKETDGYEVKVFCIKESDPQTPYEVLSFEYVLPCRSMAKVGDKFYFGTESSFATLNEKNREKVGTLLSVTLQE